MGRTTGFRSSFSCFAIAGLSLAAMPAMAEDFPNDLAAAENVVRLEPINPWNIDFGDNRCRLTRLFGSQESRHLLMFEQDAPGSQFGLTIAGDEIGRYQNARTLFFGAERDEVMRGMRFANGTIADIGPAIIKATHSIGRHEDTGSRGPAGIDLDEAGTIDRFVLKRGGRVVSFETGDMMPPFQALNTCTNDLLRVWGLDPEQHTDYERPRWLNGSTITRQIQREYPGSALRRGEQAIFRMRVIVEEDGSVSDCHLDASTLAENLDSPACREMLKAEFEPARDKEGKPMRSFYATTVTYQIG